jgi:Domain of unknown function (DUF6265)
MRGLALLLLPLALIAAQSIPEGAIHRLRWLQGDWVQIDGKRTTTEHWEVDDNGNLAGSSASGNSREAMLIARARNRKVYLTSTLPGQKPVAFKLVRSSKNEAVFENPRHDFPQRIAYRRDETGLHASISMLNGMNAKHWHYLPQD